MIKQLYDPHMFNYMWESLDQDNFVVGTYYIEDTMDGVDFIDHLADFDRFGRADMLFAKDKAIGSPLTSIHAVPDLPRHVQQRLYFLRFEDLVENPVHCMSAIFEWLGLPPCEIDPERLNMGAQESDSHYHMKYMPKQAGRIGKPARHELAPRIQAQIEAAWAWYYQSFYPAHTGVPSPAGSAVTQGAVGAGCR